MNYIPWIDPYDFEVHSIDNYLNNESSDGKKSDSEDGSEDVVPEK